MARGTADRYGESTVVAGLPAAAERTLCGLLAERLRAAVLAVDGRGAVVLCNGAAAELFGDEREALLGRSLAGLIETDAALASAIERARSGHGQALSVTLGDRATQPVALTVLPWEAAGSGAGALLLGEPPAAATATDDATHRLASIGRLSAGVAHEIRNPLSGIGTNAQVLRRRFAADDPRLRFVDFILEEVNRLDTIIEDLLRFARPPEPRMVPHDLRHSIDKVLMLAAGRIEERGVQVEVAIEGEPPPAFVDPDQIAQVLLNLVLNAVQAMPEAGHLRLELCQVAKCGPVSGASGRRASDRAADAPRRRFLELVVRDDGAGIAASDLPKLFEPFFTTRPSGTGLGLSTCQVLIRQHGGAVSVESELGRGTAVTVLIPVEKRRAAR